MISLLTNSPWSIFVINILDIAIIAFAVYKILEIMRGTRAMPLAKGVGVLLVFSVLSDVLGLSTVNWVLVQLQTMFIVAIPVVFAPELRRALEQLGTGGIFARSRHLSDNDRIAIDGILSTSLLRNIFIVNTPLHDGAVIITGDQIRAASCFLPLSENKSISMKLGTRHRAAIGLSEVSDAVVMVVSEETGAMSIAEHGRLRYNLSEEALIQTMTELLQTPEDGSLARRLKKVFRK